MIFLGIGDRMVYPRWIKPLLTIDDRVADRRQRLKELRADQDVVDRAAEEYMALVARVGTFDVNRTQTTMLDRIGALTAKNKLESVSVTPARPKSDRKTGLTRLVVTVKAIGTLRSGVEFLKDLAEISQVVRVGNAVFSPAGQKRKARGKPRLNLRVPIEVIVLSQQKVVGTIDLAKLEKPESFERHQGRNYAMIWDMKPFSEYVPPKPLRAVAGRDVNQVPGKKKRTIGGPASGGDGEYTYQWDPCDRLKDCSIAKPTVDCSEEFTQAYTVTVTDGTGATASDSIRVAIAKRKVIQIPDPPKLKKQEKPPKRIVRWPDNKYMQIRMALLCSFEAGNTDELAVYNKRAKRMEYHAVGADFDGGELLYVHPTGAVVHRNEQYFLCPIGSMLNDDIRASDLAETFEYEYPHLVAAASWYRDRDEAAAKTKAEEQARLKAEAIVEKAKKEGEAKKPKSDDAGKTKGAQTKPVPAKTWAKPKPPARKTDKKPARSSGARKKPGVRAAPREFPPLPEDILKKLQKETEDLKKQKQKSKAEPQKDEPAEEEQDDEEKTPE